MPKFILKRRVFITIYVSIAIGNTFDNFAYLI